MGLLAAPLPRKDAGSCHGLLGTNLVRKPNAAAAGRRMWGIPALSTARRERPGAKGSPPGMPTVERFPVTVYPGLGMIVRQPLRSDLRVKLFNASAWDWCNIPMRAPPRHACLLDAADKVRAPVEVALGRMRELTRQGCTVEAQVGQGHGGMGA